MDSMESVKNQSHNQRKRDPINNALKGSYDGVWGEKEEEKYVDFVVLMGDDECKG